MLSLQHVINMKLPMRCFMLVCIFEIHCAAHPAITSPFRLATAQGSTVTYDQGLPSWTSGSASPFVTVRFGGDVYYERLRLGRESPSPALPSMTGLGA